MVKNYLLFIFLVLLFCNCKINRNKCQYLLNNSSHLGLSNSFSEELKKYYDINNVTSVNRKKLVEFKMDFSTSNHISFNYENFKFIITLKDTILDINKNEYIVYANFEEKRGIQDTISAILDNGKYLGMYSKIKYNNAGSVGIEYKVISKVEIFENKKIIFSDTEIFEKYMNPNTNESYLSYTPLSIYQDKTSKIFYIYLSGVGESDIGDLNYYVMPTYFSRIEINTIQKKTKFLNLHYSMLKWYGWPYCNAKIVPF